MTVEEMHTAVKLGLDKTSSLELPAFEPEELDYWLNEAQLQIVKQKAFGNNFRGEGFEDSGKRIDDLLPLVKESSEITVSQHQFYPNVKYLSVDDIGDSDSKYMFYLSSIVKYLSSETDYEPSNGYSTIGTIPILQNEIKNLIQTEFNTPFIKTPYVFFYENKIGYIHDPYKEIDSAFIKYIKQPKELVNGSTSEYQTNESELPEQVHPEIVALTVNMLLENIESRRQESNMFHLSKKE